MYKSPRHLRPLFSRAAKRESVLTGTNKWLLQRGVLWGRESHPNRFLIWVHIFNVLVTMGLDVKFTRGGGGCYILEPGGTWNMNLPLKAPNMLRWSEPKQKLLYISCPIIAKEVRQSQTTQWSVRLDQGFICPGPFTCPDKRGYDAIDKIEKQSRKADW